VLVQTVAMCGREEREGQRERERAGYLAGMRRRRTGVETK
jgi:hypothetical protein